jgi:hypothetical protein
MICYVPRVSHLTRQHFCQCYVIKCQIIHRKIKIKIQLKKQKPSYSSLQYFCIFSIVSLEDEIGVKKIKKRKEKNQPLLKRLKHTRNIHFFSSTQYLKLGILCVCVCFFFFNFFMDDLTLDDVTLMLGANINVGMSNETYIVNEKSLNLMLKYDRETKTNLKHEQNLKIVFLKFET